MDLSILIPARNEIFLAYTIQDILEHIEGDTEIIVICDGNWPDPSVEDHPRVTLIYHNQPIGQRAATNEAAKLSTAKFIMKCDAHCSFAQGFDVTLMADCGYDWTLIPEMRNLHAFDWQCKQCGNQTYQGPYPDKCKKCDNTSEFEMVVVWKPRPHTRNSWFRFDRDLRFKYWKALKKRPESRGKLTETMSLLGACWMMHRERYWELDGLDERHGSWGQMGTELAMKSLLSGGNLICSRKVWFAHLFRTQKGFGFPYSNPGSQVQGARKHSQWMWLGNNWEKQVYPLSWLLDRFWPIPGWTEEDYAEQKKREMDVDRPGVYSIKNMVSGKVYVGSAASLSRRFCEHLRGLQGGYHDNPHLQNSYNKHGKENLSFNIEQFCDVPSLIATEQSFIDTYAESLGWDSLYNINRVAESRLGTQHSDETKDRMSQSQSGEKNHFFGKKHSAESIERMRKSHEGQVAWNRGIPCSSEARVRIGVANTGKTAWNKELTKETDERVRQYAEAKVGVHIWEGIEHPRGFAGQHHTEETRTKIRQSSINAAKRRRRDKAGRFVAEPAKGIIYYTDNRLDSRILKATQEQLKRSCNGTPIVSVSLRPIDFGENITFSGKRGILTMFEQILAGLEASTADIVFLAEHDILYHPSHFEFVPARSDVFYYNENTWRVDAETGHALFYFTKQTSGLCAYRKLLIEHYRKRVARVRNEGKYNRAIGFEPGCHKYPRGIDEYGAKSWMSKYPNIDIRHGKNLTKSRWNRNQFRNQRYCQGWKEAEEVPGWGSFEEILNDLAPVQ